MDFKEQMEIGAIQRAYRALITYMQQLRAHFAKIHGDTEVSGLYQGYMDMTYFAIFPPPLKTLDLKVAVVFNYEGFRFEAWLVGRNRKIQKRYWELFKTSNWENNRVVEPASGVDAIVEGVLADGMEILEPEKLTVRIENGVALFIAEMTEYLARQG